MSDLLPFIVTGLVTGSIYGLAAVGLVLTYKTSGVFNFAQGGLATASAFLFYTLHVQHGVAWPLAAAIVVCVLGPLMALLLERLAASLTNASLAIQVGATVGVLLIIQSVVLLIYGIAESRTVPVFLAQGDTEIFGTVVRYSELITFGFAFAATAGLYAFFRTARLGIAMRGVVDDPDLLDISGTSAVRVRRSAWLIGVCFACIAGVLFSALLPLNATVLTLLVVQAFGAAAIGAFTSLPITFGGGLLIGVLASLSTKWFTTGLLAGVPAALPFLVLFLVLLLFPRRWLVERVAVVRGERPLWVAPAPLQLGGGLAVLVFLAFVPSFAGVHLTAWTAGVAMVILFLSLGLLVRTSGQVSLGHVAFAAIGAAAFSHLSVDQGWPWLAALLAAGLIAVPIGALLSIPSIRLSGLYLALATFGFSVLLAYMFYTQSFMFGDTGEGLLMPRPSGMTGDTEFYFVVLGLALLATAVVIALERSRMGRLLRGMADSPKALATSGVAVNVTRVMVFCASAFLAAIAGALVGMSREAVSVESFPPLESLVLLALIVIVVGGAPWYALLAAGAWVVVPSYLDGADTAYWMQLAFGATAVAYAIVPPAKRSMPRSLQESIDRLFRRHHPGQAVESTRDRDRKIEPVAPGKLELDELVVKFGGLVAVGGVTLAAPTGKITGLIGPNGAGKTTTFDACSGLNRPSSGKVVLDDSSLVRTTPSARARMGLGRTFQRFELFDSLTVSENVAIGREGALAGANPLRHIVASFGDARVVSAATVESLEICGIADLAGVKVGSLSTGQRRLVELARSLAGEFRILLMDEPSSGLDPAETGRFADTLRRAVASRGLGILLVEHDMSLVMDVCDYIYVLDFGQLIFEGTPAEVRKASIVQAAYLGDAEVENAAPALEPEPTG